MILVDTSIWIDYLRAGEAGLATLLNSGRVLMHPLSTQGIDTSAVSPAEWPDQRD